MEELKKGLKSMNSNIESLYENINFIESIINNFKPNIRNIAAMTGKDGKTYFEGGLYGT